MRVLVTGGTGFIGSRLAARLAKEGLSVTAPARKGSDTKLLSPLPVEVPEADLSDPAAIGRLFDGVAAVFHLASIRGRGWSFSDREVEETNIGITANLLREAAARGVERFIYVSSVSVFGHPSGGPIDETYPCSPATRYGETKLRAERLVEAAQNEEGLPAVIIRPVITYGPGDAYGMATKLIRLVDAGRYLTVGGGENRVHLVYVDDLVEGLLLALKSLTSPGNRYILAGEEPITVNRLVGVISALLGKKVPAFRVPLRFARACAGAMEASYRFFGAGEPFLTRDKLDIMCRDRFFGWGKAARELGYVPRTGYEEGLEKTVGWLEEAGEIRRGRGARP